MSSSTEGDGDGEGRGGGSPKASKAVGVALATGTLEPRDAGRDLVGLCAAAINEPKAFGAVNHATPISMNSTANNNVKIQPRALSIVGFPFFIASRWRLRCTGFNSHSSLHSANHLVGDAPASELLLLTGREIEIYW